MVQASYLAGLSSELLLERLYDVEQVSPLTRLLLNQNRTIYLNYLFYTGNMAYMEGPLNHGVDTPFKGNRADMIHNPGGKIIMREIASGYDGLYQIIGAWIVMLDSLRARLTVRAEGHEPDRVSVETVITRLNLRCPFDGEPYRVDEQGRFLVGADYDEAKIEPRLTEILFAESRN